VDCHTFYDVLQHGFLGFHSHIFSNGQLLPGLKILPFVHFLYGDLSSDKFSLLFIILYLSGFIIFLQIPVKQVDIRNYWHSPLIFPILSNIVNTFVLLTKPLSGGPRHLRNIYFRGNYARLLFNLVLNIGLSFKVLRWYFIYNHCIIDVFHSSLHVLHFALENRKPLRVCFNRLISFPGLLDLFNDQLIFSWLLTPNLIYWSYWITTSFLEGLVSFHCIVVLKTAERFKVLFIVLF
jgi:hypothetical protein